MSEAQVEPGYSRDVAIEALRAFREGSPDWRLRWAAMFGLLAADVQRAPSLGVALPHPADRELTEIFMLLMAMFADGQRGVRNPLAQPVPLNSRPPRGSFDRLCVDQIIALAGLEIAMGKRMGRDREQSYRAAANRLNKAGADLSWREIRSVWSNRKRDRPDGTWDETIQEIAEAAYPPGSIDRLAEMVGRHMKSQGRVL